LVRLPLEAQVLEQFRGPPLVAGLVAEDQVDVRVDELGDLALEGQDDIEADRFGVADQEVLEDGPVEPEMALLPRDVPRIVAADDLQVGQDAEGVEEPQPAPARAVDVGLLPDEPRQPEPQQGASEGCLGLRVPDSLEDPGEAPERERREGGGAAPLLPQPDEGVIDPLVLGREVPLGRRGDLEPRDDPRAVRQADVPLERPRPRPAPSVGRSPDGPLLDVELGPDPLRQPLLRGTVGLHGGPRIRHTRGPRVYLRSI
jgi:hypothetical protein